MREPEIPRFTIISGGQTGVDQVALTWAIEHNVPHGGWCPRGRRAENGVIPLRFHLREAETEDYAERTRLNVRDSDGTVVITVAAVPSGGSKLTADTARQLRKPLVHLHGDSSYPGQKLVKFVRHYGIERLNVAGSRFSQEPAAVDYAAEILDEFWATFGHSLSNEDPHRQ